MPVRRRRNETENQYEGLIGQGRDFNQEKEMGTLLVEMRSATKKHSRNSSLQSSQEYDNVEKALDQIVFSDLNSRFTNDVTSNEKMITRTIGDYYKLLAACEAYIAKPGGFSMSGRARKSKVKEIQKYAQRDIKGMEQAFYAMKSMNGEQQSTLSWDEILHSARMKNIEVADLSKKESLGSAVKTGDKAARVLNEGIFIPEDFSKKDFDGNAFSTIDSEVGKRSVNLTNRNVATSRVANLLGVGELMEQSSTVTVKDTGAKKKHQGVLMSFARGTQSSKVRDSVRNNTTKALESLEEREKAATNIYAPSVQKELASLQVLDYICGQGDRNQKNFFMENEGGKYTHIHGIDNDMCFGSGVDQEEIMKSGNTESRKGKQKSYLRMVVDSNDNLMIPHIDRQLAENIVNLRADELRFVLKDLIEPDLIENAVMRLEKVKRAIKKELSNPDSKVLVEDGGWGKETHDDFMRNSTLSNLARLKKGYANVNGTGDLDALSADQKYEYQKHDSYYSDLIYDAMGFDGIMWKSGMKPKEL